MKAWESHREDERNVLSYYTSFSSKLLRFGLWIVNRNALNMDGPLLTSQQERLLLVCVHTLTNYYMHANTENQAHKHAKAL